MTVIDRAAALAEILAVLVVLLLVSLALAGGGRREALRIDIEGRQVSQVI